MTTDSRIKIDFSSKEAGDSWCSTCTSNKHRSCCRHMNDGAVDAEDFISGPFTDCACPCRGRVPKEGGRLIDLVEYLNATIEELSEDRSDLFNQVKDWELKHAAYRRHVQATISDVFDDEGNLLQRDLERLLEEDDEDADSD